MAAATYPVFQEGQTLTRDDLELLRNFLDDRTRQVGRAIGFGISCGLDGTITGGANPVLTIAPGVAIDQVGEVLPREVTTTTALAATAGAEGFAFITAGAGGFTAVLESFDDPDDAPDCNEEGCEGHAATSERKTRIVMVPGRLTTPALTSMASFLATVTPLAAAPTVAQFDTLRTAIVDEMAPELSAAAEAKLAATAIVAADGTPVRNIKAGWLNQVLFASLDLLRCRDLMSLPCFRTTPNPGVALGWAHQVGGVWQWDCDFRHHWEPPSGLSLALLGTSCEDACLLHVQRLESLILTFDLQPVPPPSSPPSGGGGNPGPYEPCKPGKKGWLDWELCGIIIEPPELIPEDWGFPWDDLFGYPPDFGPKDPWDIYGQPRPDHFNEGLIDLTQGLGRDPDLVATGIEQAIALQGLTAHVEVMTMAAAQDLAGFMPTSAASPADTIVLVKDQAGKVTMTGHVSAQDGFRDASAAIPGAIAAAEAASDAVAGMTALVAGHDKTLNSHGVDITTLKGFQSTIQQQLGNQNFLVGLDARIKLQADTVLAQYQATIGPLLDDAVLNAINKVEGNLDKRIVQYTENVATGLSKEISQVAERAEMGYQDAVRGNQRVDEVLVNVVAKGEFAEGGFPREAVKPFGNVMEAMVGALQKAGVEEGALKELQAELKTLQGHMK